MQEINRETYLKKNKYVKREYVTNRYYYNMSEGKKTKF